MRDAVRPVTDAGGPWTLMTMDVLGAALASLLALGFGGFLIGLVVHAFWSLARRRRLRRQGCCADGTVVAVIEIRDEGATYYRPTVDFVTRAGERWIEPVRTQVSQKPAVGDSITVYYEPDQPGEPFLWDSDRFAVIAVFAPVLIAMGLTFVVFGVWGLGTLVGLPPPPTEIDI